MSISRRDLLRGVALGAGHGLLRVAYGQNGNRRRALALIGDRYHNAARAFVLREASRVPGSGPSAGTAGLKLADASRAHSIAIDELSAASCVPWVAADKHTDRSCPRSIAVVKLSDPSSSPSTATDSVNDASRPHSIAVDKLSTASCPL